MKRRFVLMLDLKDDPRLIAEYRQYHKNIWPEVRESLFASGIEDLEICLLGSRMVMVMDVNDSFSFAAKAEADRANPKVQEWEQLMWKFQQAVPQSAPGEKWRPMETIFRLAD